MTLSTLSSFANDRKYMLFGRDRSGALFCTRTAQASSGWKVVCAVTASTRGGITLPSRDLQYNHLTLVGRAVALETGVYPGGSVATGDVRTFCRHFRDILLSANGYPALLSGR